MPPDQGPGYVQVKETQKPSCLRDIQCPSGLKCVPRLHFLLQNVLDRQTHNRRPISRQAQCGWGAEPVSQVTSM